MIRNYVKIAWRGLLRNSTFTIINVMGLALGIALFLFIVQYIAFEWGGNRFHKNYNQLYRLNLVHPQGSSDYALPPGFAPLLKSSFPAIKNVISIADGVGNGLVSVKGEAVKEPYREGKVSYADADFFKVFSFKLLKGDGVLNQPQTAAVSASIAKKYFGNTNALGKVLTINNQFGSTQYTVTTVYQDFPAQSDIQADILLSLTTLENAALRNDNDWADPKGLQSGYANIYMLLNDDTNYTNLAQQANLLKDKLQPENRADKFVLQPFSELHLAPRFTYPLQTFGSLILVTAFSAIALLTLIIAWVNYINLSIAQSLNRSREVGVRKVLGAMRTQLIFQFLTETLAVTLGSILIAVVLVYLLQPFFNSLINRELSLSILNQGWFWPVAALFTLSCSALSGLYVAIIITSFNPVKTLSGKVPASTGGLSFRKGLVVFQFIVSMIFIVATMVLYKQLNFMKTQNLGMTIDKRLVIVGPSVNGGKAASQSFKNQLAGLPFVEKLAASNDIPGKGYNFSAAGITRLNPAPGDEKKDYAMLLVDDKYFDTYGIGFVEGKNFTAQVVANGYKKSGIVIINQKAADQLGFKKGERIVGQKINWGTTYEIAGVIQDYHHLSLHELIQPMIFLPAVSSGYYTIALNTGGISQKISTLKKLYQVQFPGNPFDFFFLGASYDQQYQSDQRLGSVFIASALTAIFIACLGLFGMASFMAQQRVKEIGIRKVLGASVAAIIQLIASDFLKLVLLAVVIASPIAAYITNKWLEDFAYRIHIQWWVFAIAGGSAVLIAMLTVSFQSVKAALANPVKSLRSE